MNPHRPKRQDTFDLRDQIHTNDPRLTHQHYQQQVGLTSDSEHSVMEDSDVEGEDIIQDGSMDIDHNYGAERDHDLDDGEEDDTIGDYMSDSSSSLSIPNESIDFDLVYSLTNFAATVEGQASVVKGDSLFLMDDSNSYWWLVRVLKTQEVGYIPAENIETPFERLARLNRHRNVDLASATQAELDDTNPAASKSSRNRNRVAINAPDAIEGKRSVIFKRSSSVFRYPPAVWNEDEEDPDEEWTESDLEVEDAPIKDNSQEDIIEDDEMPMQEPDLHDQSADSHQEYIEDVDMARAPRQPTPIPASLQVGNGASALQTAQGQPMSEQQLRSQSSQERLRMQQAETEEKRSSPLMDPAEETGTRKLVITPSIARDSPSQQQEQEQSRSQQMQSGSGPLLPSAILQKRQEQMELERKRAREEIEAADEASRRRGTAAKGINIGLGQPPIQQHVQAQKELVRTPSQETRSSSGSGGTGGKLRKERSDKDSEDSEREGGKDKKKKGVFASIFGRNKGKDKGSKSSIENIAAVAAGTDGRQRTSDESGVSSSTHSQTPSSLTASQELGRGAQSPSPAGRVQQQAQQRTITPVQQHQGPSPRSIATSPAPAGQQAQPLSLQVSQHATSLRDRDQQQQALYSEYLKRSPSSPPDQPSYATQPASLVMPMEAGSLTSSPNGSGYGLGLAPGSSYRTQSGRPGSLILTPNIGNDGQGGVPELSVIRVFAGKNLQSEATFKTVLLNSSTTAGDLVRQSMQRFRLGAGEDVTEYYLTVKQVEGASLRIRPDERPLGVFEQLVEESEQMPMRIKRSSIGSISSVASNLSTIPAIRKLPMNDFTDDSAVKFYLNREGGDDSPTGDAPQASDVPRSEGEALKSGQFLSVSTSGINTVEPERFSSPALRFAMQLVIYPEELPDNMVFDPHTEAIVFKETLRDRSGSNATASPGISQTQRKKYFNLPKNITVAEVIELGLERFGILEGVVDGGDEVEDKLTKRRSSSRVRYTLMVQIDKQERELAPSSKVIDAFPRPPTFRRSSEFKRRSMDSGQHLLGTGEDVKSDDPLFVLRRAIAYRPTATSRHHRLSAPLDELALSHLRDSTASDSTASPTDSRSRPPSKQEIIAAQRAASRANQKAVLSTQANGQKGVDVMLPDKGMLRSQHFDADNKMRYSYTEPDGETYDISDIVEEELRSSNSNQTMTATNSTSSNDLLSGAMSGSQPSALINRVLDKIKNGPASASSSSSTFRSNSPSTYSEGGSRAATPTGPPSRMGSSNISESEVSRSRSATPTAAGASSSSQTHKQSQPSIASVLSDTSDYRTAASSTPLAMASMRNMLSPSPPVTKRPKLPKDDFGLTEMLAIIHSRADLAKPPPQPEPDDVDKLLFGTPLNIEDVHPKLRDIYAPTYQKMKEIDAELDTLLQKAITLF